MPRWEAGWAAVAGGGDPMTGNRLRPLSGIVKTPLEIKNHAIDQAGKTNQKFFSQRSGSDPSPAQGRPPPATMDELPKAIDELPRGGDVHVLVAWADVRELARLGGSDVQTSVDRMAGDQERVTRSNHGSELDVGDVRLMADGYQVRVTQVDAHPDVRVSIPASQGRSSTCNPRRPTKC